MTEGRVQTIRKAIEMKHLKEMNAMKESYTDTILNLQRKLFSQLPLKVHATLTRPELAHLCKTFVLQCA